MSVTPIIFHTDCGGSYMSKELRSFLERSKGLRSFLERSKGLRFFLERSKGLRSFLESKGITHSHREGHESHFDNQVVEC
jgi:transposase InsO family protein